MSTILNTLKKLEEEKSILDQKLDLKGMVLKDESVYPKSLESKRIKFALIAKIILGSLVFGGVAFYYWAPTHKIAEPLKHIAAKKSVQQIPTPKSTPKTRTFQGVPMAGISSDEKKPTSKPEQKINLFEQLGKTPLVISEQAIDSKSLLKYLPEEMPPHATSSNSKDIENLIGSTATRAKNNPTLQVATRNSYIPGVKVKGIIYFNEKSSSNHIIVTTTKNNNLKLRAGDQVQNATLKSIHPNRVIFSHQGQLIEVNIGQ